MSRPTDFASLVAAIQELPTGHRKAALALACNDVARDFHALADDVHAAARIAAPKATAKPIRKPIKCRQPRN
jgi:hypothetical protein